MIRHTKTSDLVAWHSHIENLSVTAQSLSPAPSCDVLCSPLSHSFSVSAAVESNHGVELQHADTSELITLRQRRGHGRRRATSGADLFGVSGVSDD